MSRSSDKRRSRGCSLHLFVVELECLCKEWGILRKVVRGDLRILAIDGEEANKKAKVVFKKKVQERIPKHLRAKDPRVVRVLDMGPAQTGVTSDHTHSGREAETDREVSAQDSGKEVKQGGKVGISLGYEVIPYSGGETDHSAQPQQEQR